MVFFLHIQRDGCSYVHEGMTDPIFIDPLPAKAQCSRARADIITCVM